MPPPRTTIVPAVVPRPITITIVDGRRCVIDWRRRCVIDWRRRVIDRWRAIDRHTDADTDRDVRLRRRGEPCAKRSDGQQRDELLHLVPPSDACTRPMIGSIRHGTLPFQDMKKTVALPFASVSKCNRVRCVGIGVRRRSFCETRSIPFYRCAAVKRCRCSLRHARPIAALRARAPSGKRGRLA